MIWTNIKLLEDKISSRRLTEAEGISYFMASVIYSTIFSYLSLAQGLNYYSLLTILASGVTMVLSVYYSYDIHKQGNTFDFLQNYFALTWVIRMRLLFYWLIYVIIYLSIFNQRQQSPLALTSNLLFQLSLDIAFFTMTTQSFNRVTNRR